MATTDPPERKSRATFANTLDDTGPAHERSVRPVRTSVHRASIRDLKQRRASLGGQVVGEARAALGLGSRPTAALLPALASTPLGHFMGTAADEDLESLARAFMTVNFTAGQPLPAGAIYFVTSGSVAVRHADWRVVKGAGEWIFNGPTIKPHELDPRNFR